MISPVKTHVRIQDGQTFSYLAETTGPVDCGDKEGPLEDVALSTEAVFRDTGVHLKADLLNHRVTLTDPRTRHAVTLKDVDAVPTQTEDHGWGLLLRDPLLSETILDNGDILMNSDCENIVDVTFRLRDGQVSASNWVTGRSVPATFDDGYIVSGATRLQPFVEPDLVHR